MRMDMKALVFLAALVTLTGCEKPARYAVVPVAQSAVLVEGDTGRTWMLITDGEGHESWRARSRNGD